MLKFLVNLLRRPIFLIPSIVLLFLAWIIYPAFLAKVRSSRQSQAKNLLIQTTRAQAAYYIKFKDFANSFHELDALPLVSPRKQTAGTYNTARKYFNFDFVETQNQSITLYAISRLDNLKSFVGVVFVPIGKNVNNLAEKDLKILICVANTEGKQQPRPPFLKNNEPFCAEGTTQIR